LKNIFDIDNLIQKQTIKNMMMLEFLAEYLIIISIKETIAPMHKLQTHSQIIRK